ncbi:hypothetical protein [Candidatus Electronema sp. PJ]
MESATKEFGLAKLLSYQAAKESCRPGKELYSAEEEFCRVPKEFGRL